MPMLPDDMSNDPLPDAPIAQWLTGPFSQELPVEIVPALDRLRREMAQVEQAGEQLEPLRASSAWRGGSAGGWRKISGVGRRSLRGRGSSSVIGLGSLAVVVAALMIQYISKSTNWRVAHTYATATGQKAIVTLPDGSQVKIAPQSQLTIPGNFGTTTRAITLAGEAYFEVASASGTPFLVHTGRITTRVLGTTFDVRYYANDPFARVTVVQGKVETQTPHVKTIVVAGTVEYLADSIVQTTRETDMSEYTDWIDGRLVFNKTPASVMLATVGRWYGYHFQLTDSVLAARRVITTFQVGHAAETLRAIQQLLNVTMTFNGSTIILQPRPAAHTSGATLDSRSLSFTDKEIGK